MLSLGQIACMKRSLCLLLACLALGCQSENGRSGSGAAAGAGQFPAPAGTTPRSDTARDGVETEPRTPQASPTDKAWLIVPGQSAGNTRIGEDAEKVYQLLGRPDDADAAMQKAVAVWYSNHNPKGHSTAIYTERSPGDRENPPALVKQIWVTSPSFKTAEGLGPGSSREEIARVFTLTKGETYKEAGQTFSVYESPAGIAFEVDAHDRCSAVIVCKPGDKGGSTYLKFRFH